MLKENVKLWEEELRNRGRAIGFAESWARGWTRVRAKREAVNRITGMAVNNVRVLLRIAREGAAIRSGTLPPDVLTPISQAEPETLRRVIRSMVHAKPQPHCADFPADGIPPAPDSQPDSH